MRGTCSKILKCYKGTILNKVWWYRHKNKTKLEFKKTENSIENKNIVYYEDDTK